MHKNIHSLSNVKYHVDRQDEFDLMPYKIKWFYTKKKVHIHLAAFQSIEAFHYDTQVHPVCDTDAKKARKDATRGEFAHTVYTPREFITKLTRGNKGRLSYILIQSGGVDHNDDMSMLKGIRPRQDWDNATSWTRSKTTPWEWQCNDSSGDVFGLHRYYNGADPFNDELWRTGNCVEDLGGFKNYKILRTDTESYDTDNPVEEDKGGIVTEDESEGGEDESAGESARVKRPRLS